MATRVPKKSAKKKPVAKVAKKKASAPKVNPKVSAFKIAPRRSAHAARPSAGSVAKARAVKQYDHPTKKRLNNPPVGLVTPDTDPDLSPKTYAYDPHLDPQLVWTGKEEKTELTVDTVSLHVHERIDPYTIIEAVRNKESFVEQTSLFATPAENPPLREAVDFYKHQHDWSNRLIAGDSLLVMNSLIEREGMAGQVQMIYIDPPYGITYGSNFQPFVNKRSVVDSNDDDLTQEPEMIRAFRDTWSLGIHSYLTYLRDRLTLARDLLNEKGSIFVQISDENLDLVKTVMREVFGSENLVAVITFTKTAGGLEATTRIPSRTDFLIWFARDISKMTYHALYEQRADPIAAGFTMIELRDGTRRAVTADERNGKQALPTGGKLFRSDSLTKPGPGAKYTIDVLGRTFHSGNRWWGMPKESLQALIEMKRVFVAGNTLRFVKYLDDFPYKPLSNLWDGLIGAQEPVYVVQTNTEVVERCILMTTDAGDVTFDPTSGSGTTAYASEKWGRRWIACDTSRVAISLAKRRLMTTSFDYFELKDAAEGIDGGLRYETQARITPSVLSSGTAPTPETLYDRPFVDRGKVRVTGPFTVEAVPAPLVAAMNQDADVSSVDQTIGRSGATQRHSDWRAELLASGARGVGGAIVRFSRVEPLVGTRYLHAEAETAEEKPRRVAVSFGPEYQPLEQRQVELAWEEARSLDPRPDIVLFAAFQFDPEAAKDIDEMPAAVTKKTTFLKAQMNPDLLTEDLKKKRSSNQSFWLVGRPDVEVVPITTGQDKGKYQVTVHGFDYYDVKTGQIESGDAGRIAMWMLDPDYDGRSIFPRQVFFPNAGDKDGWTRLAKTLRAELDEDLLESYLGTESIPFTAGQHRRIAVKIIDNRGIESLRVVDLP